MSEPITNVLKPSEYESVFNEDFINLEHKELL